jgi:hypothetical protein
VALLAGLDVLLVRAALRRRARSGVFVALLAGLDVLFVRAALISSHFAILALYDDASGADWNTTRHSN